MISTSRRIEWFSKTTEIIVGYEELKQFDLELFKKIFNHAYEDDPYMCGGGYDILEEHVSFIQPLIKHKIKLEKYYYGFATYSINDTDPGAGG